MRIGDCLKFTVNNSPIQAYVHLDDHAQPTYFMCVASFGLQGSTLRPVANVTSFYSVATKFIMPGHQPDPQHR